MLSTGQGSDYATDTRGRMGYLGPGDRRREGVDPMSEQMPLPWTEAADYPGDSPPVQRRSATPNL